MVMFVEMEDNLLALNDCAPRQVVVLERDKQRVICVCVC